MKTRRPLPAALIVVPLAVLAAAAMASAAEHAEHDAEVTLSPQAIQSAGIRVERVGEHILRPMVTAAGRISFNADQVAHVGSAVSGRVTEIKAALGSAVRKGDVLLVLSSPEWGDAQSDYLTRSTAVLTARALLEAAQVAFERADALYQESKGIALAEVRRRRTEFKTAQGALLEARAAATAAMNKLRLLGMGTDAIAALEKTGEIDPRFPIRAPIDGQVIERETTLGELARPDQEALLVLANLNTLWVIADVPQARLADVAPGASARIHPGEPGRVLRGNVSYISPMLDPTTRTAAVRIVMPNEDGMRPGMFVRVELESTAAASDRPAAAVPEGAVQAVDGRPCVFVPVEDEPGTFVRRFVTVGPGVDGMIPIRSGLSVGEGVVVDGGFILKAEMGKGSAAHEH